MEKTRENKENYYRCYSITLRNFLKENGVEHIISAYDIKTRCQLWLYYKSDKFNEMLKVWNDNNPRKK